MFKPQVCAESPVLRLLTALLWTLLLLQSYRKYLTSRQDAGNSSISHLFTRQEPQSLVPTSCTSLYKFLHRLRIITSLHRESEQENHSRNDQVIQWKRSISNNGSFISLNQSKMQKMHQLQLLKGEYLLYLLYIYDRKANISFIFYVFYYW